MKKAVFIIGLAIAGSAFFAACSKGGGGGGGGGGGSLATTPGVCAAQGALWTQQWGCIPITSVGICPSNPSLGSYGGGTCNVPLSGSALNGNTCNFNNQYNPYASGGYNPYNAGYSPYGGGGFGNGFSNPQQVCGYYLGPQPPTYIGAYPVQPMMVQPNVWLYFGIF